MTSTSSLMIKDFVFFIGGVLLLLGSLLVIVMASILPGLGRYVGYLVSVFLILAGIGAILYSLIMDFKIIFNIGKLVKGDSSGESTSK